MTNELTVDEIRQCIAALDYWDDQWKKNRPIIAKLQAALAAPPAAISPAPLNLPSIDQIAQQIRWLNGSNKMGAGKLAEELHAWLSAALSQGDVSGEGEGA